LGVTGLPVRTVDEAGIRDARIRMANRNSLGILEFAMHTLDPGARESIARVTSVESPQSACRRQLHWPSATESPEQCECPCLLGFFANSRIEMTPIGISLCERDLPVDMFVGVLPITPHRSSEVANDQGGRIDATTKEALWDKYFTGACNAGLISQPAQWSPCQWM